MRKSILPTIFGLAFVLMGTGALHAQNLATQAAKELHNQMLPANYDAWKRSATRGAEIAPNRLISTSTSGGYTTYNIQLGFNLTDATDAVAYENKIKAQPGITSITADHTDNKVVVIIKEEDEHNALETYFDIQ